MLSGTTEFKCDICGAHFSSMAIEWNATAYLSPMRCPKCGSLHTYPIGLYNLRGLLGPGPIYKMIWKEMDTYPIRDNRQIFQNNCIDASKEFILFEKALLYDKESTINRIKGFPVPDGLAKHWELVIALCEDFSEYSAININAFPLMAAFGITNSTKIITSSDQFINLLVQISKSEIKDIDFDIFFDERSRIRPAKQLCKTIIDRLKCLGGTSSVSKQTILGVLKGISKPEGFEYIHEFVDSMLEDYAENGSVDLASYSIPDGVAVSIPPFPIRGISGIIDIVKSISLTDKFQIQPPPKMC